MKKAAFLLSFFLLTLPLRAELLVGKVVGVSDGDTLRLLVNRQEVRIRLHGVDAPESKQPFGDKAKQFTSKMAFGKQARAFVEGTDRYGRKVAEVFIGGFSLNRELVKNGLAWAYRQYSTEYLGEEIAAKKAKKGLWADQNPVAPWEWRKRRADRQRAAKQAKEPPVARLQRQLNGVWQDVNRPDITLEIRRNATNGGTLYFWNSDRVYSQQPYTLEKGSVIQTPDFSYRIVKLENDRMEWAILPLKKGDEKAIFKRLPSHLKRG